MSTGDVPALKSSMKELVGLAGAPDAIWNSLILIGLTLRTFTIAVSDRGTSTASAHLALATRSPFQAVGPEVIVNVILAGEAVSPIGVDALCPTAFQPAGTATLNSRPVTAAPL